MKEAYEFASRRLDRMGSAVQLFPEIFPPLDVYLGRITVEQYLSFETRGVSNKYITLEEMLLLFLANENPAFRRFSELFDDRGLRRETPYLPIISCIEEFLRTQKPFGPFGQSLFDLLMAPMRAHPDSLYDQLEYIRKHWGHFLAELFIKILGGMDLIREETRFRGFFKGDAPVPFFGLRELEDLERFSPDVDWMSSLVLMAKSVYVWLFQLSRKYRRDIWRLDHIPDEELETLARWGFSGLWLIGIWERSPASKKVKQWTGNPEAAPSAYSIYDYVISHSLGGEEAFSNLKSRALKYGIRMATDMVPNHVGIYSKWVIEHPDWFIQLRHSPFPGYRFTGGNLSDDDRVDIRIEDGYWSRTDAAVVFQRVDRWTGDVRYIYHGNDGTSMPWNDTAQLDLLKHEVREALINETIEIARKFPIIRFDAAMTLAKRHYQRLWYPPPGYGGDIPSRSENSVSQEEFDRLFPVEFWRELVDRIAVEAPNTLLLAEAFWLMEGYFVRSLGMHRVYNSAFMNMLKMEDNSKYRDVMKNVLRFNPEILKRFVNFMNNPDEESAVAQFGKGDKYFGVATLMATLPGLPMFGHGQVEGFAEKYGMEYYKSYWDESVDEDLVRRHEREIFPLLKKRHLFSGVEDFVLYDVQTPEGHVNEDVFAYSNMYGDERTLVVYNNRYADAFGTIRRSVGMNIERSGRRHIIHKSLAEGLKLRNEPDLYYVLHDEKTGLEYLRNSRRLWDEGFQVSLGAYKCHMFSSFTELRDFDGSCHRLDQMLDGRGVPDMMYLLQEMRYEKVLGPFRTLLHEKGLKAMLAAGRGTGAVPVDFREKVHAFYRNAGEFLGEARFAAEPADQAISLIEALFSLDRLRAEKGRRSKPLSRLCSCLPEDLSPDLNGWRIPVIYSLAARIGALQRSGGVGPKTRAFMDEWLLNRAVADCLGSLGADPGRAAYESLLIRVLVKYQDVSGTSSVKAFRQKMKDMLEDEELRDFLSFNLFGDTWWFNKESMELFLSWTGLVMAMERLSGGRRPEAQAKKELGSIDEMVRAVQEVADASGYQAAKLVQLLEKGADS
jgi:glycosidase